MRRDIVNQKATKTSETSCENQDAHAGGIVTVADATSRTTPLNSKLPMHAASDALGDDGPPMMTSLVTIVDKMSYVVYAGLAPTMKPETDANSSHDVVEDVLVLS